MTVFDTTFGRVPIDNVCSSRLKTQMPVTPAHRDCRRRTKSRPRAPTAASARDFDPRSQPSTVGLRTDTYTKRAVATFQC
ncbi:hypothetical protein EVAR_82132_1 [Eumeta japonica]|uniref:Uncharacterized protein n=1 Tax=Eumeta variegata TaxID=151549 RepID=A0A4C1U1V0_EUMVA|nr:hypothetical protein EVAR_82132_1 [Eumeta japonica]